MKYIFIINGRKDKQHILYVVKSQLADISDLPSYEIYITRCRKDATSYVENICTSRPSEEICFVACGGDGTLCEVATGYMRAKASAKNKSIALLALGTGNDFARYYPNSDFKSIKALLSATPKQIDSIKVNNVYSINIINVGFDALAGYIGGKLSSVGFKKPYIFGVIAAIFTGRFNKISVEIDGKKIGNKRMLLCTIANSKFVGEGMLCAPKASNDDGLIDLFYLKTMTLYRAIQIFFSYIKGTHLDNPKFADKIIYEQTAKDIVISSHHTIKLILDGEPLIGNKFNITIEPKTITLMVP